MSNLILVNESDEAIGSIEKMEAHKKGLLHRAFSIFIFNDKGEMLLQQRALNKYHSGGLWTNACCSHPAPLQDTKAAAVKRLREEMGFTTDISEAFTFIYRVEFENGLTEHEFDHVFTGVYSGDIYPDNTEVRDHCFMSLDDIRASIEMFPQKYTGWFKIAFPKIEAYLAANPLQNNKSII